MFTGEYHHNLDTKGRMMIPAKFREDGYNEFTLTRSLDGCLSLYAIPEWKELEEKLQALPMTSKQARTLKRFLLGSAISCECDKQGRILIPQTLREKASLEKDVVLLGVGDHGRFGPRACGTTTMISPTTNSLQRIWKVWESNGISAQKHFA